MRSFNQPFLLFALAVIVSLSAVVDTALSAPANPDLRADYKRHLLSSPPPPVIYGAKNGFTFNEAAYISEIQPGGTDSDISAYTNLDHHRHYAHHQLKQSENFSKPLSPKNISPFKLYPGSPAGLPTYFHKYAALKKGIFTHLQAKVAEHLQAASNTLKLLQMSANARPGEGDNNGELYMN